MAQGRARVPGMSTGGVLLEGPAVAGRSISYPVIVEQILHACGVNATPMEDGAVMLRFPSTNGLVVSVPLSAQGCASLIEKVQEAMGAGQQPPPGDTVPE